MKKINLFLVFYCSLVITHYSFAQSGWFAQKNNDSNYYFRDLFFVNSNTGWVVGLGGKIVKTTNGGNNWIPQVSNTGYSLHIVRFINSQTGYAAGGSQYNNPFCFDYKILIKTTNGGETWFPVIEQSDDHVIKDLFLINGDSLYYVNAGTDMNCMGNVGSFVKTNNSGSNWLYLSPTNVSKYYALSFINPHTGWTVCFRGTDVLPHYRLFFKTTNGGANWTQLRSDTALGYLNNAKKLKYFDTLSGYFCDVSLFRTTNGGYNWNKYLATELQNNVSFHALNKDTLWVITGNGIYRTNNQGANWISQNTPFASTLYNIYFIDKNTGWAVGSFGTIIKTTNGGVTGLQNLNEIIPSSFSLSQNYPNPFNPTTIIRFQIKDSKTTTLKVFDLLGREVQTLVNEKLKPGEYEVTFNGSALPSGVYFYKLQAGDFTDTKKLVLIK